MTMPRDDLPIKRHDASNRAKPKSQRPGSGFGKTLHDFVAPLRTARGQENQSGGAEYWREEAEKAEDAGDKSGAFKAWLKWRETRMRETED